ncbi:HD domain-containing protein [Sodalis sp. RH16]|uniref:HD domain-containing protein n=1 Tax=unclassified Sodalis (in: enterobacteria) TaxID=2636512 RepID=UPI0039B6983F
MINNSTPDYLCYWGKARKKDQIGDEPYHLLAYHCLDVAACGNLMVQNHLFGSKAMLASCSSRMW